MTINIKPSHLIERFLWDDYEKYCLEGVSTSEVAQIIKKDQEFQISEQDAFVIGLLCTIYTNEVGYKFKLFLKAILENKSFNIDSKYFINRELLIDETKKFEKKIPKDWKSNDPIFNKGLKELPKIMLEFEQNLHKLPTVSIQDWPCVNYISVKKIINKL